MKIKITLLCLLVCSFAFSQTKVGRQNVDQYPVNSYGTITYGLTWLPTDYNNTSDKYPLIIFLHGAGECGDGVSGLNRLLTWGLPKMIANGWDPAAVNPVDGKNYKFIVASPQAPGSSRWSYSYSHVKSILANLMSRYRIDPNRIYISGISAGGAGTWSSVTNTDEFTRQIAAIAPVSSVGINNPSVERVNIPFITGKNGVKVWAICGLQDSHYSTSSKYISQINTASPAPDVTAKITGLSGLSHEGRAFDTPYDPNWKSNALNLNMYQWMLQYARNLSVPTPPTPPAPPVTPPVTDPETYISIPGKIEAENYSSMSGIQTQNTSDAGGGLNVGWVDAGDWMIYNVSTSNAGQYNINLRLASPALLGKLEIRNEAGQTLTSVDVPQRSSHQDWSTVTAAVNLPSGKQKLRIVCIIGGWNINWIEFANYVAPSIPSEPVPSEPPPTVTGKTINVNLYAGSVLYNNSAWNNWSLSSYVMNNVNSPSLKYSDGSSSSVKANLSYSYAVSDNGSSYKGTIVAPEVLRLTSYSTNKRNLSITGLSTTKKYSLVLYASRGMNSSCYTIFGIGNAKDTVSTYMNYTSSATFSNLSPDAQGRILVTIDKIGPYNYLNGFSISELTEQTVSASANMEPELLSLSNLVDISVNRSDLNVFPNPASQYFTLSINNNYSGLVDIQLLDINGSVRSRISFSKSAGLITRKIDCNQLASGTYLVRVTQGKLSSTIKIAKY